MELKAPPSGELPSQVVPVKAPDVPAAFGPAAAIIDETGELSTHPAEPQLLFQPVRPPSPPPKPQLVFSDEVGKSSQLFIDITNSHFQYRTFSCNCVFISNVDIFAIKFRIAHLKSLSVPLTVKIKN